MPLIESKYRGTRYYNESYRLLVASARSRDLITYKPLIDILGLSNGNYAQSQVSHLLGEIAEDAHRAGFPLLTAIVINKITKRPGSGFFELAQSFGKLPIGVNEQQRERFWRSETERVYDAKRPISAALLRPSANR